MRYATILSLAFFAGCGPDGGKQPPFAELYPAKGVVLRGGQPVSGGSVQFKVGEAQTEFLINSEVGADGTFTLSTVRTTDSSGERKTGAPAGSYTAICRPPVADQTKGNADPITLLKPVVVGASANELKLDLPPKK